MMRVNNFLSRVSLVAALASGLFATTAFAQTAGFTGRNSYSLTPPDYNGVPYAGEIVVYSLPTVAVSPPHPGPVDYTFDLAARVSGGPSVSATAFGYIGTIGAPTVGSGSVIFVPPAIGGGPNPPNNIEYSVSTPANNNLDIMYGVTGVQGGGTTTIGITALNDAAGVNVTISNNDGLAAIPIRVSAGTAFNGSPGPNVARFPLTHGPDPTFTGFVNAAGTILTNAGSHANNVIEVRKPLIADYNGDGFVDFLDLDGIALQLLGNPGDYEAANPWLAGVAQYIGDVGGDPNDPLCTPDGFVDFLDIDGIAERFLGAGCVTDPSPAASPSAVPEPSSVVLGLVGLIAAAAVARRRNRG